MRTRIINRFGSLIGRRLSRVLSRTVSNDVTGLVHEARGLSEPLSRALLDSFLTDRIVTATWPSVVVLAAVVSIHFLSMFALSAEYDRILAGLVVLLALVWSIYGTVQGVRALGPHVRLWFVTRLSPIKQARLLIFQQIRLLHTNLTAVKEGVGFTQNIAAAAVEHFQHANGVGPNQVAFMLADHLAPVLVRHLLRRGAFLIMPLAGAFLYYRMVLYPGIIARHTDIGPWNVALYPLAALADALAGTHLRATLQGQ